MNEKSKIKKLLKKNRQKKVRSKISGTSKVPRLSIFRSLNEIYAQIIDDEAGKTLVSANTKSIKKGKRVEKANEVGKLVGKKAVEKKITKVVFDRAGYKYHGRVKAVAEGARESGLKF